MHPVYATGIPCIYILGYYVFSRMHGCKISKDGVSDSVSYLILFG